MGRASSGSGLLDVVITVVIVVVLLVGVVLPIVLLSRRRAKAAIEASVGQPFAYGVPMSPAGGSFRDVGVDVVGLPGVVSVMPFVPAIARFTLDPVRLAGQASMDEKPGRIHLKVPLGPDWPRLSILYRAGAQQLGTALARSMGTAGTEIVTGDPAFDGRYRIASGTPDPRPALAVVNPAVRQMILGGRVQRWQIGGGMWLEVGYDDAYQEAAAIDWTIRLAALIVTSSGIPVIRPGPPGPPGPPAYGGGQVPG